MPKMSKLPKMPKINDNQVLALPPYELRNGNNSTIFFVLANRSLGISVHLGHLQPGVPYEDAGQNRIFYDDPFYHHLSSDL